MMKKGSLGLVSGIALSMAVSPLVVAKSVKIGVLSWMGAQGSLPVLRFCSAR